MIVILQVHIQKVLDNQGVRSRWLAKFGRQPTEEDVDRMYARFVPLQKEALKTNSDMIPGMMICAATCIYIANQGQRVVFP